jgi:hypothetical protein
VQSSKEEVADCLRSLTAHFQEGGVHPDPVCSITGDITVKSSDTTIADDPDVAFHDAYRQFSELAKWILPSGATVEDVLYLGYTERKGLSDEVQKSIRNWTVIVESRAPLACIIYPS